MQATHEYPSTRRPSIIQYRTYENLTPPPFCRGMSRHNDASPFLVKISFGFARPSPLLPLSPPLSLSLSLFLSLSTNPLAVKLRCSCRRASNSLPFELSCDHRRFRFDRQTPYNWYRNSTLQSRRKLTWEPGGEGKKNFEPRWKLFRESVEGGGGGCFEVQ